jgi:hypothetical protein
MSDDSRELLMKVADELEKRCPGTRVLCTRHKVHEHPCISFADRVAGRYRAAEVPEGAKKLSSIPVVRLVPQLLELWGPDLITEAVDRIAAR